MVLDERAEGLGFKSLLAAASVFLPYAAEFAYCAGICHKRPYSLLVLATSYGLVSGLVVFVGGRLLRAKVLAPMAALSIWCLYSAHPMLGFMATGERLDIIDLCWGTAIAGSAWAAIWMEVYVLRRHRNWLGRVVAMREDDKDRKNLAYQVAYEGTKVYIERTFLVGILVATTLGVCMTILWTGPEHAFKFESYNDRWFEAVFMLLVCSLSIVWLASCLGIPFLNEAARLKDEMVTRGQDESSSERPS